MTRSLFAALLFFALSCTHSLAQQFLNMDFERMGIEGVDRPWGWSIDSYTNSKVGLDTIVKHHGEYSLAISTVEPTEETSLSFSLEPFQLKNESVKVDAWVRSKDLEGAAFFSVIYSNGIDEVEQKSAEVNQMADWSLVSIDIKFPADLKLVSLMLHHKGKGIVWFDDMSLSVKGKKVEEVEVAPAFEVSQLKWLSTNSYPIDKVDASLPGDRNNYKDLEAFKLLVNDARIIALGEATHGTGEFFRMKHRILQYCVQELGVRVFAIEDNQLTVQRVNRYVAGGPGDARSCMYGMFGVWQTEEVRDMIQWTRQYNDHHPDDKVEFAGFDVQTIEEPMDSLYSFVKREAPDLLLQVTSLLDELKREGPNSYSLPDSVKLVWLNNAENVLSMLAARKGDWMMASTGREAKMNIEWGIQYATLVKQYAENIYKGHISLYRDVAMAENVSWILDTHKPGTKILLWAHNNHISRGDHANNDINVYNGRSMGSHLSKKYGAAYKAFELSTYSGEYWGQVSYFDFRMVNCPLYNAPRGSLDEALHQVILQKKSPALLLDMSGARDQPWLISPRPERFANHVNIEYGYWTQFSIPYQYDGVFFIDTTSSARSYAK